MKKTILTIMVAAMMLVAFTACEQAQMPTYRNVDYITIKQVADFVEGQPFDAANFQVIAHNTDNTETVIDGQGLVTIDTAAGKSWKNGDVVATLGTEKQLTAGYQVAFKKVTSVEFSGITSVTAVEGADITTMAGVKIDGSADATVTLNYDGGSVTVPLTAISETVFNVVDGTTRVTTAGKEGDVYDVYIVDRYQFAGENEVSVTTPIATNLELKVVKAENTEVAKVKVTVTTSNGEWFGQPVAVKLEAVDANGNLVESAGTDGVLALGTDVVVKGATATAAFPTTLDGTRHVYDLSYVENPTVVCEQVIIPVGQDYVASATYTSAKVKDTVKYAAGQPINASDLEIPVTYANTAAHTAQEYAAPADIYLITTQVPTTGSSFNLRYQVRTGYNGTWSAVQTISSVAFTGGSN